MRCQKFEIIIDLAFVKTCQGLKETALIIRRSGPQPYHEDSYVEYSHGYWIRIYMKIVNLASLDQAFVVGNINLYKLK